MYLGSNETYDNICRGVAVVNWASPESVTVFQQGIHTQIEKWLSQNSIQLQDDEIILKIWDSCSALGGYLAERGSTADFSQITRMKREALKAAGEFRDRFC